MKLKKNQRRFKNFMIRKDVQLPVIVINLIFLGFVCAVLILVLLSPLYHDMLSTEDLWVQHVSGSLFLILLQRLALAMLLILILATVHQVILSHRFCGPLVNFGHTFTKMADGDFSRKVHLRKNDFLKAEALQVNAIIDRLNNDGAILGDNVNRMAATLSLLSLQEVPPETAELIKKLQQSVDNCRDVVSTWHPTLPQK
jgi:methyl-accepting chemotaxis protein